MKNLKVRFLFVFLFGTSFSVPNVISAFNAGTIIEVISVSPDKKTKKTKDGGIKGSVEITKSDEISLVVSADGPTKSDAIAMALRSAIEQAFGTFVSANTTILNDELVKDEIATITSGNIKGYKELSSSTLPNGNTSVSLQAVVSIGKLISYSQSHGSSAEFAGQQFMMQKRMLDLNAKNEKAAIENLLEEFLAVKHTFYNYNMTVGTPIKIELKRPRRENESFRVKEYEIKGRTGLYKATLPDDSKETPLFVAGLTSSDEDNYLISLTIEVQTTENFKHFAEKFVGIWKTLALSKEEVNLYKESNFKLYELDYFRMVQKINYNDHHSMWNEIERDEVFFRTDAMNRVSGQIVENLQQPELVLLKKTSDVEKSLDPFAVKCHISLGCCNPLIWRGRIDDPSSLKYAIKRHSESSQTWSFFPFDQRSNFRDRERNFPFVLYMDQWNLKGAQIYGVYICSEDELEKIVGFEFYDPKAGRKTINSNSKKEEKSSNSKSEKRKRNSRSDWQ